MSEETKTNSKTGLKLGPRNLAILIAVVAVIFFFIDYSWPGARLIVGVLLLFFAPMYILLDSFDIPIEEKLIFPFFMGIGVVPLLVFYIEKIVGSFRISILICFVLLTAGATLFRRYYKRRREGEPDGKQDKKDN